MRVAKTTVLAGFALFVAAAAAAQQAGDGFVLKGDPNEAPNEILAEVAQISGAAIAGVMIVGPMTASPPALSARIPREWAGSDMCVMLVSDDGRYEAARDYAVPAGWTGGHADIPYPTRYAAFLRETTTDTLAVTVRQGGCATSEDEYALAGWNADISSEPETAKLLVNSYRADEVYLIAHDTDEQIVCEELRKERRTAFDFACNLPARLVYGQGAVTIEVNRVRDGQIETAKVIDLSRTSRGH